MNRLLIISSTLLEVRALLASCTGISPHTVTGSGLYRGPESVDLLLTGVGQMQAAYAIAQTLSTQRYDAAINPGIAGSFRDTFPLLSTVQVYEETLADLGAESPDGPLDLFQMNLLHPDAAPFTGGTLRQQPFPLHSLAGIPSAKSVTVNRVLSNQESIAAITRRYDPDVVNMEGAALFYGCLLNQTPLISIRTISDRVGLRDKGTWDIPGAVSELASATIPVIQEAREFNFAVSAD